MSKFRDRTCANCDKTEYNTATKSEVCVKCYRLKKNQKKRAEERAFIEALGYSDIREAEPSAQGKTRWSFTHSACGTEQTWTFNNLLARTKADTKNVPCSTCGGKRRQRARMDAYMEKYARTYDLAVYEDYVHKVRMLSDKIYVMNQASLNPLGLVRSMTDHHLDHKVPIIVCFLENLPIEVAADIKNLELLEATSNLSKGKFYFDFTLLEELKVMVVL